MEARGNTAAELLHASLIPILGFDEYRESLRTADVEVAPVRAAIRNAEVEVELQAALAQLKLQQTTNATPAPATLSPTALQYIREAVRAHTLSEDEQVRRARPDLESLDAYESIRAEQFDDAGRALATGRVAVGIPQRVSLQNTLECVAKYINVSSGGARLQAVAQGLVMALSAKGLNYGDVQAGHVNAADTASISAGDVECFVEGINVLTVEVKDRALTPAELQSSVDKARLGNVKELLFFVHRPSFPPVALEDQATAQAILQNQFSLGLNIYIEQALSMLRLSCTLLGEDGRKIFLQSVGTALGLQGADSQHRWEWSKAVSSIGVVAV